MKLVDASAWVEFLRRKGDLDVKLAVAALLRADAAAYTSPTRFELLSGVKPDEQADLDEALSLSHHIPFQEKDWIDAAILERTLRAKGVTIPRNDLFVVTIAIRSKLPILCRDAHFDAARNILGSNLRVEQV
jgi:predicted nucleic acid-binding protein